MHTEPTGHANLPSLDAELPLTNSETESNEEVHVINARDQDEGQAGPNPGEQDEGQAGPNPDIKDEGQAGSNPGDAAESQAQPSHGVHAGPNREHMDLEATDASSQQKPEQMDEVFTTTAYLNVQENLKLPTEDQVILEEPASSIGTLSSLQNLEKNLNFTDQFFIEKPHEEESGKTNAKIEVQSMVSVPIHQDTSSVPPMTTPVIDLTTMKSDSPLPTSTAITLIIITKTSLPPPPQPRQSIADPILVSRIVDWAMQAPLRARFRDLPTVDMKEILQQRMFEDNSYKAHEVHNDLYEALQKSLELDYSNQRLADQEEARKKKRKKRAAPRTPSGSPPSPPPPPPPPAGASGAPGSTQQVGNEAPSSSKPATSTHQSIAWTTSDTRFESIDFTAAQELSPTDSLMQDDSILDEQRQADFEGQAYEVVKAFYLDVIHLQFQMEECHKMFTNQIDWMNPDGDQVRVDVNQPLPLGGPPGHVTIQPQFFFNKDLEYLRYGSKGCNLALSISKMKAASYPDFGLELLVPEQIWIDDVCTYDISAKYGISHWWFNRQKFYIDRHDSSLRRKDVRTHMQILSVVRIKAYSIYGYDYLSEIVLRRADFQEHTIAEKDFKNMYPSDFEDLNLLLLQGHLDHLAGSDKRMLSTVVKLWTRNLMIRQRVKDFQLDIESYQTQLNLTKPGLDATGYEFKHDYTIIESPRAVVFSVDNNDRKIMRFNEIYKFSDGTLTRILEALDYKVKEFKVKRRNPGINTRFWTEKDVTRSKEFIAAIERCCDSREIREVLSSKRGQCSYSSPTSSLALASALFLSSCSKIIVKIAYFKYLIIIECSTGFDVTYSYGVYIFSSVLAFSEVVVEISDHF
ncbi:hypothetical protein Tco_0978824 [Tanacetum coccineum]|uniref:Uncharacterized protein n=1 Tax=Tanacetum coccineum TaxID=301880 RepID=A0ABQ5EP75_9ASTR